MTRNENRIPIRFVISIFTLIVISYSSVSMGSPQIFPGADEKTPSLAQYFSWINNTNEGSTEENTMINLDFFQWLHDEYGMVLDIYAYDAGNIDGPRYYGSMDTDKFKNQFPVGWDGIYQKAKSFDCRLGIWLGPDGYGDTPEQENARRNMLVKFCKDYEFMLFKVDAVCGQLRTEKQDAFAQTMIECRKYSPDLIVLNHRLNLGDALPHATTSLWEGAETYIDVHMPNRSTATHNRAGALSRGLPPDLQRLTEDHGVCLSSCLDYWEDDLILQAFNRCMILAPEIYGSPWFLRDDEFPKLARIYNLHRRYRDILVNGMVLPEDQYGPNAVSRGDGNTRFITLRNLTWNPITYKIKLDSTIGLTGSGRVGVTRFHPSEKILGQFNPGTEVGVEVLPFRSCLLMATTEPLSEIGVMGCDYEIVRDTPGKSIIVKLLGLPGTTSNVSLVPGTRRLENATLDGVPVEFTREKTIEVRFPGQPINNPWHRKLGDLTSCDVPGDAEALYEATCFAADNNALEVRSLFRSGPTNIPQVQKARDAFFNQQMFIDRALWDKFLFDDNSDTCFEVCQRWGFVTAGSLRIDFGKPINLDRLVIHTVAVETQPHRRARNAAQPEEPGALTAQVSTDLKTWQTVEVIQKKQAITCAISNDQPIRYCRLNVAPDKISEIIGYKKDTPLDRSKWSASNLLHEYTKKPATTAWNLNFTLDQAPQGSYLAVPLIGRHGTEGAYAALRMDGQLIGASRRAVSFSSNVWEYRVRSSDRNYTYFFPVTQAMIGKKIELVVLGLDPENTNFKPEAWITAYPIPYQQKTLVLTSSDND